MPDNTVIGNINTIETTAGTAIKSSNSPFAESFYFEDYYDEKAVKRFIKIVEKLIRTSREYNTYIELVRTNIGVLNHDNLLHNITTADVDLEFHHYPFSLYDITEIVMTQHIIKKEKFTSFSIAKEVMKLHYQHKIGLVPVTKTTHELIHSGNLFISSKQIFGDYKSFMKEYSNGISYELGNKVVKMEELSEKGIPSDFKGLLDA